MISTRYSAFSARAFDVDGLYEKFQCFHISILDSINPDSSRMSTNKRPRKVKVPWDTSSDIYASIVTDDSLAASISANFTGMEKDEENVGTF